MSSVSFPVSLSRPSFAPPTPSSCTFPFAQSLPPPIYLFLFCVAAAWPRQPTAATCVAKQTVHQPPPLGCPLNLPSVRLLHHETHSPLILTPFSLSASGSLFVYLLPANLASNEPPTVSVQLHSTFSLSIRFRVRVESRLPAVFFC